MAEPEEIQFHTDLLAIYRRNLKRHLRQRAVLGALAPFSLEESVREAYIQIARSKDLLRSRRIAVEDDPDDTPAESTQPALSPLYRLPQLETRGCSVDYSFWKNTQSEQFITLDLRAAFFMTQPSDQTTFFPSHRLGIKFRLMNHELGPWFGGTKFHASDRKNTSVSDGGIEIKGPTLFELKYLVHTKMAPTIESSLHGPMYMEFVFQPASSETNIPIMLEMKYVGAVPKGGRWQYGFYTFILW
jgi:hypothetical protein